MATHSIVAPGIETGRARLIAVTSPQPSPAFRTKLATEKNIVAE